ncbi:uncharacterized protein LOC132284874 [Cornus florida]|uniref:uncharacterized protein LOC132284874 n=1 Tax=Cornus florida TaxID=4283 RepID=UPI0028A2BD34|nr:uncharacterized protein LOC132284874 [Cornus florida]
MERKKKLYKQLPKQEQNWPNWWSSIESEFRAIFADVCNGLKLLFNRDFVHGNLINDGVVITRNTTSEIINTIENTMCGIIQEFDFGEGRALITRLEIREEIRAKLLLSRAGDGFRLRGATKDIQDLHLLMMDVLTVSGDIAKHTVRAGLPKALELILGSPDNITPISFQHFLRILVGLCSALVLT